LIDPDKFQVLYLEGIMDEMKSISGDNPKTSWMNEFISRYDVRYLTNQLQ